MKGKLIPFSIALAFGVAFPNGAYLRREARPRSEASLDSCFRSAAQKGDSRCFPILQAPLCIGVISC